MKKEEKKIKVLKNQNNFRIIDFVEIVDSLPNDHFTLETDMFGNHSFNRIPKLSIPDVIYGEEDKFIDHVVKSWETSNKNVGVLLAGGKGLGKSLVAARIIDRINVPVIHINKALTGTSDLSEFKKIKKDICIFFDEFEKIVPRFSRMEYENGTNVEKISQEDLLNFLDPGANSSQKMLCIFTANDKNQVSEYLLNRPGRIKYFKEYNSMKLSLIKEIIEDLLEDKNMTEDLLEHLPYFGLNTDALISIINEINIHKMPYSSFKDFFNFKEDKISDYEIFDKKGILLGTVKSSLLRAKSYVISNNNEHYYATEDIVLSTLKDEESFKTKLSLNGQENYVDVEFKKKINRFSNADLTLAF